MSKQRPDYHRSIRNSARKLIAAFAVGTSLVFSSATLLAQAPVQAKTSAQSITRVGRYTLQSNPWVNLHQRLLYASQFKADPPASLSGDDLAKWKKAETDYRLFIGKRNAISNAELIQMNAILSQTTAAKLPDSIPKAAATVLEGIMPLYRSAQWDADNRANLFCVAVVKPMLESAGEELAEAHTKVYGVPFPTHILVDVVTPYAWEFGAYTVGEPASVHTVISSADPANQGFRALEAMMHEPSHVIVDMNSGAVGGDLNRIAKELGVRPRYNLWHAILFYTAGELTRQALAKRGVEYQPIITLMYDRGFGGMKQALETHWQAYIDGKVSRDEALRQILIETTPANKP
ncbi:MAG TPA: hypothetical protein VLL54_10830 [Pyrinomonadaceae bacterium]|nr:hypothetical protein [Pyrinomonadaceae bacterium]